jgi:hypothetical protein
MYGSIERHHDQTELTSLVASNPGNATGSSANDATRATNENDAVWEDLAAAADDYDYDVEGVSPMGRWKDGLLDCCGSYLRPCSSAKLCDIVTCHALFCPQILVSERTSIRQVAFPQALSGGHLSLLLSDGSSLDPSRTELVWY